MKNILIIFACFLSFAVHAEINVYFGTLHAHSNLSDGKKDVSAMEAYQFARDQGGLDFISLSEHNHMLTATEMQTLIQSSDDETKSNFVALYGQEYSTIKKGFNHTNIQNYPIAIPKSQNGQYKKIFGTVLTAYLAAHPDEVVFAGFNHPKKLETDYGLEKDFGGKWDDFVADMDPIVQLIAIQSGPADSSKKDFQITDNNDLIHRNIEFLGDWFDYLSHGMHLAPKVDHDTHSLTYGRRIAGRTAVWVEGDLTKDKLLAALASRHVYAMEDTNLEIIPVLSTGNLPGDILILNPGDTVQLTLNISDPNEPDADYELELFQGETGSGNRPTAIDPAILSGDGTKSFDLPIDVDVEAYFIVHIKQKSADPDSGSDHADAWLAPVWIEWAQESDDLSEDSDESVLFLGSKRSKVYHLPGCRVIKQIAPHNLVTYSEEPSGKRLHQNCPFH